jgi:hypothetical protein
VGLPAYSENLFYQSNCFITVQLQIDIARYSKLISPKDSGHNEEREEKLLERCPPGHEGTKLVEIPATILDASGAIIAWYLPDALTDATQVCNIYCYSMDIEHRMVPTEGNLGSLRFAHSNPQKKRKG